MIPEFFFVLFSGLVFGSFITCASYRMPLEENFVTKPSYCPKCKTKLGFKDLWPVFSWLAFKGKCRHCHAPIHVRYPLIELITAITFLLIYMRFGLTPLGVVVALFTVALLIMIVADFEHYIIPDEVHLALFPLGIIYHLMIDTPFMEMAIGCAVGLGLGLALHYGYRYLRKKEGLGFGDVKFLAVVGLWLGVKAFVPFLFYAGVLGVVTGLLWRMLKRGPLFPFGPALALSLFIGVVYPETSNIFWNIGKIVTNTYN